MRGLSLISLILLLNNSASPSDKNQKGGIPGSDLPEIRSGFSVLQTPADLLQNACRDLVALNKTTNSSNSYSGVNIERAINNLESALVLSIKPKLTEKLRESSIIDPLILPSGFSLGDQSLLVLAGCYIRLGINLRGLNSPNKNVLLGLAATSLLNGGTLYAQHASQSEGFEKVTSLISAAQCYYWAFRNEENTARKASIRYLADQYISWAKNDAFKLDLNERFFQLDDIERISSLLRS